MNRDKTYAALLDALADPPDSITPRVDPAQVDDLASWLEQALYMRTLRGRITGAWLTLLDRLPFWLVLVVSREERRAHRDWKRDHEEARP